MYYFASDIHLGAGGEAFAQQTERRFVRWLDDAAQDAAKAMTGRQHLISPRNSSGVTPIMQMLGNTFLYLQPDSSIH